jgi:hypothetical protein
MLYVYPRQEVEIWAGVFERVDHVVWHVGACACLRVDPSVPGSTNVNVLGAGTANAGDHART